MKTRKVFIVWHWCRHENTGRYIMGVPMWNPRQDPYMRLMATFKTREQAMRYLEKQMKLNPYIEPYVRERNLKGGNDEKSTTNCSSYDVSGTIKLRKTNNN